MNGLADIDRALLLRAISLADNCPPSTTAFAVGALIAMADGRVLGEGWSRKSDPHEHAEEAALADVADPACWQKPRSNPPSSCVAHAPRDR